jgi:hypothetical protein
VFLKKYFKDKKIQDNHKINLKKKNIFNIELKQKEKGTIFKRLIIEIVKNRNDKRLIAIKELLILFNSFLIKLFINE